MEDIESESKFIWKLILDILLTPITLLLIIFKKKEFKDLFQPFYDILKFVFEPKFIITIIILNIIIYFLSIYFMSEALYKSLIMYPENILNWRLHTLITAGFLHINLLHLFGNCLAIFIFGRVVERKIGFVKTAIAYFIAMIIGSLLYSIIQLFFIGNNVSALGASGALMGLVATAILIDPLYITYELLIPLPIMVVGWLAIYADITGILNPTETGIGYFAHLGGYLSVTLTMFLIGIDEREKLKKGLIINLISLAIAGIIYFLIISGYIPTFDIANFDITKYIEYLKGIFGI